MAVVLVLDQDYATNAPVAAGTAPVNVTAAEALIGSGAWQANGAAKSSVWLGAETALGREFKVSEIAGFEWHTKTDVVDNYDWYMTIYTKADGVNDDSGWYGRRLTIENLYALNYNEPLNTWNKWSTGGDSGNNAVTFYDGNRTNTGFYNGPTLTDIQDPSFTWADYATSGSAAAINYADEKVLDFVFETGSAWAAQYTGLIDGVTITLTTGETVTYDLEVIPEPVTLTLLGLGGLAVFRRKRA
jgi:hypothetical protein